MNKTLFLSLSLFSLVGCQSLHTQHKPSQSQIPTIIPDNDSLTSSQNKQANTIIGDYVTDGYFKRNEGYDWYVVRVIGSNHDSIHLSIRSRIDIKKPTCTFDTIAHKIDDSLYQFSVFENPIDITFANDTLIIDGAHDHILKTGYYCSGGANLAGQYQKLTDELDTQHLDEF